MKMRTIITFDEICPICSIVTTNPVLLPDFLATLKIHKNPNLIKISSNFLHSISTCICIRENYKIGEFSTFHFW